jgi:hypothetical protein
LKINFYNQKILWNKLKGLIKKENNHINLFLIQNYPNIHQFILTNNDNLNYQFIKMAFYYKFLIILIINTFILSFFITIIFFIILLLHFFKLIK